MTRHITWDTAVSEFLDYKHSLGYVYDTSNASRLRPLALLLAGVGVITPESTKPVVDGFSGRRDGESERSWHDRAVLARQFMLFLSGRGLACHVPPTRGRRTPTSDFTPRIITPDEMARIIDQADHRPASTLVYSMMIRLLWSCGLRIGEAVKLRIRDVDLDTGCVTIRHAKNDRTRLVPMSGSLARYAAWYCEDSGLHTTDPDAWFLPTSRGGAYRPGSASAHVKMIMAEAGVTRDDGTPPRTHDIRHSHAVAVLTRLQADGTDVRVALPVLATFMGHASITSTEYYLRLTVPERGTVTTVMADADARVFPRCGIGD